MNAMLTDFGTATLVETSAASLALMNMKGRLSLRVRGDLAALNAALDVTLPTRIGGTVAGEIEIACLGPDEWVILAPLGEIERLQAASAALYPNLPHSLVHISGREISLLITGPRAAELLTLGCPRNIDAIAPGSARRTIFDGVTVILWRKAEDCFQMDIWNSFAAHLLHLLETGCRELAAESI